MSKNTKPKNSLMWEVLREQGKSNKRLIVVLLAVLVMWFATIAGFVWYLNQYDYSATTTTTVTVDGADGTATYQRGEGNEITYG